MKIGIIGGGAAGLAAAWLLEQEYEVILFEKKDRLGGHIQTEYLSLGNEIIPVEAGVEFFSKPLFPYFFRLLQLLEIPVRLYPISYTFYATQTKKLLSFPPISPHKILWRSFLPSCMLLLIQLHSVLSQGKRVSNELAVATTVQEFLDTCWISNSFKEDFFYPFYAGVWGFPIEDVM